MATLTGQTVASTYPLLIKLPTSGVTGVYKTAEDGLGTASALQISTGGVKSTGLLESTGNANIGGAVAVTGLATVGTTLGVTGATTLSSTLLVTGAATLSSTAAITSNATVGGTLGVTGVITAPAGVSGNLTGNVTGNVVGNLTGAVTGNSSTSTSLQTTRNIELTGDISGTATFNGTANAVIATTLTAAVVPTGAVFAFAAAVSPVGFLACNGVAVSRSTYSSLFAIVSTTFGVGDGSTTFNLPDLRGEFVRGFDAGRGVDSGRVFGSAQDDELESHTHNLSGLVPSSPAPISPYDGWAAGNRWTNSTTGTSGAAGGTETRPRNIAMLYCIKH